MASAANSLSPANASAANAMNNNMSQGSSRGPLRPNTAMKSADMGRRQSGSPVDGGNRRNNPQRAWSQNTNPMGQKGSGPYTHQNGGGPNRKSNVSPRPIAGKESNTSDLHAHDRLIFLLTAFIGLNTTITTKTGEKFSGIFSGSSLEPNETVFVLKMARRYSPEGDTIRPNGLSDHNSPYLGSGPDHQMIFEAQDIVSVAVANVSTAGMAAKEQNGATTGFRTDSDISAGHHPGRERELQRWEPGTTDTAVDLSLESTSTAGWDQFETNARLFGATSSYDENLYTTRIDRNDPDYKRKEAEAARIAREIESSQTDNPHLREERGQLPENDTLDEEERYSGVRRDDTNFPPLQSGQPNKYMPPARRQPAAAKPTTTGAPADPAIVSAQIARAKPFEQKSPAAPALPKTTDAPKEAATEPQKPADSSKTQETSKAAPPEKPAAESEAKNTSAKPGPSATVSPKPAAAAGKPSHVGAEVLNQFRQFANSEKARFQECRRNQASYDRTIKLNELMKFAQNFKLTTPVPKDLIPILAKDRNKQKEIVERAQRQAEETAAAKAAAAAAAAANANNNNNNNNNNNANNNEQKPAPPRAPDGPQYRTPMAPPAAAPTDRQPYTRGRQGYPPMGPHGRPMQHQSIHAGRGGSGMLSHRLADIQQQRKGAGMSVPPPLSMHEARHPPSAPVGGGDHSGSHKPIPTPASATSTKFNARAMEFKPNPTASAFTPAGTSAVSSSPASNARTRSLSRAPSPSAFFGAKKPLPASERPSLNDNFNPIKRMKKEATEQSAKDYAFNGGIPPAYRTPPTWEVSPMNKDKTYADMFKGPVVPPPLTSQGRSASNPPMPHHHQLPFHLQQGSHAGPHSTGPPHLIHPQQHHPAGLPHFDDPHRMHMSASSSQAFPSPRLPHNHMAYQQSPMGHHAQLAMGQPMPPFYGPHPTHLRHYPGAPQFGNPQNGMAAPMMVQQASSGPYMGVPQGMGAPYNPQMHMYSPNPGHAYPHVQPPPQPHSGYPSPSRGAPMMVHQGSQQGHPSPVMYMNPGQHGQPFYGSQHPSHMPPVRPGQQQHPPYSSSPHQGPHYPPPQHRGQGNNFSHGPHMPPPPMQPQQPPQAPAASGNHPPENPEDVK